MHAPRTVDGVTSGAFDTITRSTAGRFPVVESRVVTLWGEAYPFVSSRWPSAAASNRPAGPVATPPGRKLVVNDDLNPGWIQIVVSHANKGVGGRAFDVDGLSHVCLLLRGTRGWLQIPAAVSFAPCFPAMMRFRVNAGRGPLFHPNRTACRRKTDGLTPKRRENTRVK